MISDLDEPLRVTIITSADAEAVVQLDGELDPHTAPLLEETLTRLASDDIKGLVIELAGLDFMDSSGLRVLINAHKGLEAKGATLTLRHPNVTISRLLDVTNLRAHLNVED